MDFQKLHNDLTTVVISSLQYFDELDKHPNIQQYLEVGDPLKSGLARFRQDPVFRAKVLTLTSRISSVISDHVPNP